MKTIAPYAKAITGAIVAGLASAQQALLDDSAISSAEGVGIAIATLTALALVWAIPNGGGVPADDESYEEAGGAPFASHNDYGYGDTDDPM